MRAPSLTVAAVQPVCVGHDVAGNATAHARAVLDAQARLVVMPELSLTGYELDAAPVGGDDAALAPIVDACAATGAVALVGAPIAEAGRQYIATLAVDARGVRAVYRKRWLGGRESARFHAGDEPTVIDVDGWRVGLGICKDTGAARHIAGVADLGVDVYAAGLVHRPEELAEQDARAAVIARACRAFVVFASFAGSTGDVFGETAGCSAVYSPDGHVMQRAGPQAGGVVRATLPRSR